jgi:hypothetical protein
VAGAGENINFAIFNEISNEHWRRSYLDTSISSISLLLSQNFPIRKLNILNEKSKMNHSYRQFCLDEISAQI